MKSFGERFVGDSIQKYSRGDLVLTGPNLPHQWQKDISFKGKNALKDHIYVLQFKEDFFGVEFFGRKEMELVVELFERAKRGGLLWYRNKSKNSTFNGDID